MNKIVALFSLLIILTLIGCDDDCHLCAPASFCSFEEARESFANTDCLAEELVIGCPNIFCDSREPDIELNKPELCEVIDCQTLSCDNFVVDNAVMQQSGFVTEITIDEDNGLPTGFFELETLNSRFTCGIVVP